MLESEEAVELIENFCGMHLGCNLRKAFLAGVKSAMMSDDESMTNDADSRIYHKVDTLVHEFHKLFGKSGTPEYGCGSLLFPDFLELMGDDEREKDADYFKSCLNVTLDRQIGSRYFVTASNAMFLKDAISFLEYTFKNVKGNKLERDLYSKLKDPKELVLVKMDGLVFYHVFADLVTLVKSRKLKKSVLDMGTHYLEPSHIFTGTAKTPIFNHVS